MLRLGIAFVWGALCTSASELSSQSEGFWGGRNLQCSSDIRVCAHNVTERPLHAKYCALALKGF